MVDGDPGNPGPVDRLKAGRIFQRPNLHGRRRRVPFIQPHGFQPFFPLFFFLSPSSCSIEGDLQPLIAVTDTPLSLAGSRNDGRPAVQSAVYGAEPPLWAAQTGRWSVVPHRSYAVKRGVVWPQPPTWPPNGPADSATALAGFPLSKRLLGRIGTLLLSFPFLSLSTVRAARTFIAFLGPHSGPHRKCGLLCYYCCASSDRHGLLARLSFCNGPRGLKYLVTLLRMPRCWMQNDGLKRPLEGLFERSRISRFNLVPTIPSDTIVILVVVGARGPLPIKSSGA